MGLWSVLDNFSRVYPHLKIILTLSPVRHLKDGIPENQLSKSMLRVLCSNLERRMESVSYFPAYEIMMDELRDYRFYKPDRIHPTEEAENYIWEKWKSCIFFLRNPIQSHRNPKSATRTCPSTFQSREHFSSEIPSKPTHQTGTIGRRI
ncbi:GSCFA domain-containing protein [Algoriphagus boritolerans]|uniref:GSCFA domain-containing protein n=1 Tax=Algoriphagus boritolerans TaxID=308111 RepID=UPI000AD4FD33